jgi:hypothetical protein
MQFLIDNSRKYTGLEKLGMVARAYNPSYLGGEIGKIESRPPQIKKLVRLHLKEQAYNKGSELAHFIYVYCIHFEILTCTPPYYL